MQWDSFDYKVADHYLSALINADLSGMDDAEIARCQEWESQSYADARSAGFTVGHWSDVEGSGEDWGTCDVSGLLAMRCTVRLLVYRTTAQEAATC